MIRLASKRNVRKKQCSGTNGKPKTRYETQEDAWHSAQRMRHDGKGDINPYKCSFCHKWHVGHTPLNKVEFATYGKEKH